MKPTVGTPTNPVEAVYAKNIYADNYPHFPIGAFVPFGGNTSIPVGFLLCNGASVARATYPKLFEILGTTYGAVDDAHFNLPNFTEGTFLEGAETAGEVKEAGLPNIEGSINSPANFAFSMGQNYNEGNTTVSGAFANSVNGGYSHNNSIANFDNKLKNIVLNASLSNPIYGNSDTVQPKSVTVRWFVKAFDGASEDSTDLEITNVANDVIRISADMVKKSEADYVVDSYHNDDGNWYRKYSDGWVEQGGKITTNDIGSDAMTGTVNLLVPFTDNTYSVFLQSCSNSDIMTLYGQSSGAINPSNILTPTSFNYQIVDRNNRAEVVRYFNWYACGMGAGL